MAHKPCAQCGQMLVVGKRSRPEPVCHPCRRAAKSDRTCPCGSPVAKHRNAQYCSIICANRHKLRPPRPRRTATCGHCAEVFTVGKYSSGQYCSRDCSYAAKSRPISTPFACIVKYIQCQMCGAVMVKGQSRPYKYCSDACTKAAARKWNVDNRPPKLSRQVWFLSCLDCGVLYCARAASSKRCRPCRVLHEWRTKKRHREQRKNGGVAKLIGYIGPRDKWICGICCRPVVSRKYSHHDRMSPTVDHIVPVSEGGSNDPSNLRLAHMLCNSRRQHFGGGEQLALVG